MNNLRDRIDLLESFDEGTEISGLIQSLVQAAYNLSSYSREEDCLILVEMAENACKEYFDNADDDEIYEEMDPLYEKLTGKKFVRQEKEEGSVGQNDELVRLIKQIDIDGITNIKDTWGKIQRLVYPIEEVALKLQTQLDKRWGIGVTEISISDDDIMVFEHTKGSRMRGLTEQYYGYQVRYTHVD